MSRPGTLRTLRRAIRDDVAHVFKRRASLRRARRFAAGPQPLRIEVGSGERRGRDGWLTLDTAKGCDLYWDLREGLPFPDESVETIYSSHFLEHLTYREGEAFLAECMRALRPGGTFSICVPNARLYLEGYARGDRMERFLCHAPAVNCSTTIDCVNYIAYMDGHHKYLFDEENLLHRLRHCGLEDVALRPFDPAIDLDWRDFESIYAIGRKPPG